MCSRYSRHANSEVISLAFKLGLMPEIKVHYNIAPSTQIPIVRDDKEKGRVAEFYRWRLIPGWAKDPAIDSRTVFPVTSAFADSSGESCR